MSAISSATQPDRNNPRAQALLLAAEEILAEAGPEGLSARAVAERAGVAKGLVFYYWGNTNALFDEVLERYYARHKSALAESFAGGGDVSERIHQVIEAYLRFMEENRGYARIVQQQVATAGEALPLVSRHYSQMLGMTKEMLVDLLPSDGPLSARNFHLTLSAITINYFTYAPVLQDEPWPGGDAFSEEALADRRAHVHWLVDAWLVGLKAR